ncbi:UDP-GlcNAc:betaGal beta-1,3-N-acetylglucosaminyltransferase-like protein 1 isoform X2 [Perognathus longimembris pacificus]|uniref:UDP-GlcNAc:betaGal beta-1,3-N-acetylglucosaminyltransferase-like protein 1 isoform X2 n=1 Tax=Perognathus longimembris pacificus TaxID=214514 RepID=UPI002019EC8A|nr:UDP-GlcNAc:betaGal beta-1,3-N-acetylglucosaminyltransferase-like protein 1 isoform X2 [Perognathus longimembris pacificus]
MMPDKSMTIIEKWKVKLEGSGIPVVIGGHASPSPRGVGYSKNQAVAQSSGTYLCFLDSDDVMLPQRVRLQHEAAVQHPKSIIGCQVQRDPPNSTKRYTRWINQLAPDQLLTQVFTSNGPTVIMPTWFCSRTWFLHVGPFDEGGKGVPEDLLFFYEHLRKGGSVFRVDHSLLLYRYHLYATTHSVLETTIWTHRVHFLEEQALPRWASFTIWNAGKQGRRLYRSLTAANQHKVVAFCDVDRNKIKKGFYCYEDAQVCGPSREGSPTHSWKMQPPAPGVQYRGRLLCAPHGAGPGGQFATVGVTALVLLRLSRLLEIGTAVRPALTGSGPLSHHPRVLQGPFFREEPE